MSTDLITIDPKTGEILPADPQAAPPQTELDIYRGASSLKLTDEEGRTLRAPFPDDVIMERPIDHLLYVPQVFIRERLNDVIGVGQWALIPHSVKRDGRTVLFDASLYIRDHFVARAMGGADYIPSNPKHSWDDAWESAKSDCITRCCKDLGIAADLWKPGFADAWRERTGNSKPESSHPTGPSGMDELLPSCPVCSGAMWDNRAKKAAGKYKDNAPDYKCKETSCDGKYWPGQWPPAEPVPSPSDSPLLTQLLSTYSTDLLDRHAQKRGLGVIAAAPSDVLEMIDKHLRRQQDPDRRSACDACNEGPAGPVEDASEEPDAGGPPPHSYADLVAQVKSFASDGSVGSAQAEAVWRTVRNGFDAAPESVRLLISVKGKSQERCRPMLIKLLHELSTSDEPIEQDQDGDAA